MARVSEHRTGAKGQRRREEILEVATALFTTQGYEATTTQDLADVLGVRKGSMYYYFASKEELLFEVLLRNHEELHCHVAGAVGAVGIEGLDAIRTFVTEHVLFVLGHRAVSSLYADEVRVVRVVPPWWAALTSERGRHERLLLRLIKRAQANREIISDLDATLTARAFLAIANAPLRWFHPSGRYRPETVAKHHADLALRSLRP